MAMTGAENSSFQSLFSRIFVFKINKHSRFPFTTLDGSTRTHRNSDSSCPRTYYSVTHARKCCFRERARVLLHLRYGAVPALVYRAVFPFPSPWTGCKTQFVKNGARLMDLF